jgi:hypothetical protein
VALLAEMSRALVPSRRVYLPLHGFADSLNLGVATALILQRLCDMCLPSTAQ